MKPHTGQEASDTRSQVMFGMMVSRGNIDQAEKTAAMFAKVAKSGDMLGIQTDDLVRDEAPLKSFMEKRRSEAWENVFVWDKQCDDAWQATWPPLMPHLFYTGNDIFSYGGAFNRLLVLALVAKAPTLVRVDAGTAPLSSFGVSFTKHLDLLDNHPVVSGGYDGRLALRDLKGLDDPTLHEFRKLVRKHSSVNPYHQLTGGACFALRPESGPPAIAFPGILPVWASDDAFFQRVEPSSFVNAPDQDPDRKKKGVQPRDPMIVERKEGGQPMTGPEYLARLASAVALHSIHNKARLSVRLVPALDAVVTAGKAFLDELRKTFPDAVLASHHGGALLRLKTRALGLIEGYENYVALHDLWSDVCHQITKTAAITDRSLPFNICRL